MLDIVFNGAVKQNFMPITINHNYFNNFSVVYHENTIRIYVTNVDGFFFNNYDGSHICTKIHKEKNTQLIKRIIVRVC